MHIEKIEFLKSVYNVSSFPKKSLPSLAFAGRSNAGKSSLINCLLKKKDIAKTSSKPGKTICLNYFIINNKYYFVDLPGYGYSKVPGSVRKDWEPVINHFMEKNDQLKCIVVVVDIQARRRKTTTEFISACILLFHQKQMRIASCTSFEVSIYTIYPSRC